MRANISFVTPRLATGGDLHHESETEELQLLDLVQQGVSHIVDCRIEGDDERFVASRHPEVEYLHHGVDGLRGPSMAFAALLAMGYGPVDAIQAIRSVRPISAVDYAEDALDWFHVSREVPAEQRAVDIEALRDWRSANPHETVRIIGRIRRGEDPMEVS